MTDRDMSCECLRAIICLTCDISQRRRCRGGEPVSRQSPMAQSELSMNRSRAWDWHAECHVGRP